MSRSNLNSIKSISISVCLLALLGAFTLVGSSALMTGCTVETGGDGAPIPNDDGSDIDSNGGDIGSNGDSGTDQGGGQGVDDAKAVWTAAFDASGAGALSSVWGNSPSDVFVVGGRPEQGEIYHYDGTTWRKMVVPDVGLLVWVYGFASNDVFAVGVDGGAVHYDGVSWTALDTGTTHDLWGVWGRAPDDLWVVGGNVGEDDPTILHYDGTRFVKFPMPPNDRNVTSMFKVWGIGDKLFSVGQNGIIIQFVDGGWVQVPTGELANDDFVSLWGTSEDHIVAVGGRRGARIATYDGESWTTIAPEGMPGLSAVCTDDPNLAIIGGVSGFVARFNPTTGELIPEDIDTDQAIHAAWADGTGRYYAVGGRFTNPYTGVAFMRTNGDPGVIPTVPVETFAACGADDDCQAGHRCVANECVPFAGCTGPDADTDGWLDSCDNCPNVFNPDQADDDHDGFGDACDICDNYRDDADYDHDGVPDLCDRCPGFDDRADADNDGTPDACDKCPGHSDLLDADTDGVPDACDRCDGSDDDVDADNDGVPDGCDVCPGFIDVLDADHDGVPNACDVCPGFDDKVDTDDDGLPNGCDDCLGDNSVDTDGDGIPDDCDACPGFDDDVDADGDGVADGCDACPGFNDAADSDRDGVPNGCDVCPGFNDNNDADGDGIPNGCDECTGDDTVDSDGDTVPDACDVCDDEDDTLDADSDGFPDACDTCAGFNDAIDTDEDSVADGCDICPGFNDGLDSDGDHVPNGCDPCPFDKPDDSDGDGVCNSQDACPGFDDSLDDDGDGTPNACDVCPGANDSFDTDGDGVPNGCDPCPVDNPDDSDGDGICNSSDICPGYNDAVDSDGDSVPDGCDRCPGFNDSIDADNDDVPDACDACPGFDDNIDDDGNGIPNGCCVAEADCVLGESCQSGYCEPVAFDIELGYGNPYTRIPEGGDMPLVAGFQGFADLYLSYRTYNYTPNGSMSITLKITLVDLGAVIHPEATDPVEFFTQVAPGINERLEHYWIIFYNPFQFYNSEADVVLTIKDNANPSKTTTITQRVVIRQAQ